MQPSNTNSISFIAIALQSVFLILLYLGFQYSGSDEPALWAGMIYLMLAYGLRYFVPVHHRKGLRELKQGNYEEALKHFEKSIVFFTRHPWIDRFRAFTIFSASKVSYLEMAKMNKYSCLEALGSVEEYYKEF